MWGFALRRPKFKGWQLAMWKIATVSQNFLLIVGSNFTFLISRDRFSLLQIRPCTLENNGILNFKTRKETFNKTDGEKLLTWSLSFSIGTVNGSNSGGPSGDFPSRFLGPGRPGCGSVCRCRTRGCRVCWRWRRSCRCRTFCWRASTTRAAVRHWSVWKGLKFSRYFYKFICFLNYLKAFSL